MGIDRRELAAIFAGGALGALARVELTRALGSPATSFPWTVFAINVAGAFVLAFFVTRLQERLPLSTYRRPFVGTGFCGALTTFSTMQLQLWQLLDLDRYAVAAAYLLGSVAAGYVAVVLATALARRTG